MANSQWLTFQVTIPAPIRGNQTRREPERVTAFHHLLRLAVFLSATAERLFNDPGFARSDVVWRAKKADLVAAILFQDGGGRLFAGRSPSLHG